MSSAGPIRGVILAGGTGTRLLPLTARCNKHLLAVGDRPMILHPYGALVRAGVRELALVSGPADLDALAAALPDGPARVTRFEQAEPLGIAHALSTTRAWSRGDPLLVVLGDNVFNAPLAPEIARYREAGKGARVLLKAVPDPTRFGVARFEADRLVEVVEKPAVAPSGLAVTGIYFYDARVFDFIDELRPSARGEYEIADVNTRYLGEDEMSWGLLEGDWTDAGTHASLARARALVAAW